MKVIYIKYQDIHHNNTRCVKTILTSLSKSLNNKSGIIDVIEKCTKTTRALFV